MLTLLKPSVLVNRFILNLRQATGTTDSTSTKPGQSASQVSDPAFVVPQSYLGDIGEELEPRDEEDEVFTDDTDAEINDGVVNVGGGYHHKESI